MKGYIYYHKSPSGKYYIGQTLQQSPEKRWGNGGVHYDRNAPFGKAIIKYGWDSFEHGIITEVEADTREELVEKMNALEIHYIEEFDCYLPKGYNCVKTDERGVHKTNEKGVCQFDRNKNLIQTFPSAAEAARSVGLKQAHTNIVQCCKHKQHSCGGYYWEYEGNECNPKPIARARQRAVIAINEITLQEVAEFPSATEAARQTGLQDGTSIIRVIQGKRKTAGGFMWRYKGDDL